VETLDLANAVIARLPSGGSVPETGVPIVSSHPVVETPTFVGLDLQAVEHVAKSAVARTKDNVVNVPFVLARLAHRIRFHHART